MSLLDALKSVENEHFDASKGKVNENTQLPEGTYDVILSGVVHGIRKNSNTDFIMFSLKVMSGDQTGQVESIFPTLAEKTSKGNPMPDFVLSRSIKTIKVIGAMVGLDVPNDCFTGVNETEDYSKIETVFKPYIGQALQMTIRLSPNKKNPDNPYRNYSFAKLEQPKVEKVDKKQDPFEGNEGSDVNIDDDSLPF